MEPGRTEAQRTPPRRRPRKLLAFALIVPVLLGVVANRLFDENSADNKTGSVIGELRTVNLHGVPVAGCTEVCPEYNIDTNFSTRLGTVSQFAALVPGRTHAEGELFLNGFAGTLVDVDGELMTDLRTVDPGLETIFKRILSGVVADFDNDGYNEILYGLNSYNLFASEEDVRYRQRRSFEMLKTESGDVSGYVSANETVFPMGECPPDGATTCTGYYDWRIDGDVTNVAAADFDNDGWTDIAYLGTSLGDHSWIGFATDLAAAGIPLSNENGARIGVALNRGSAAPGVFTWQRETSALEAYLRDLYPFSDEVDYAPKSLRLLAEDLDGDGNVDLLVAGERVVIGWGDGTGEFPLVESVLDTPGGTDAAVADVDKDGDLDLFVLADSQPRYIALPRVSCAPQPECAERGRNEGGTSALYLSDGGRRFTRSLEFQALEQPTGVTAADVDFDGWPDFVLTCVSCVGPGVLQAQVEGDALNGYELAPLAPGAGHTYMRRSVALDVDGDGDTDVILSGSRGAFRQVWVNGSTGSAGVGLLPFGPLLLLLPAAFGALAWRRMRRPRPGESPET